MVLTICLKATPADPVNSRAWCWFDDGVKKYYPFFLLSLPLLVLAGVNLILYVVSLRFVYQLVSKSARSAPSSLAMQDPLLDRESGVSSSGNVQPRPGISWRFVGLFMYPLVYIIAALFPLLLHMNVGLSSDDTHGEVVILPTNGIAFAAAGFAPAQGFLNCIIYFSSYAPARSRLRQIMQCLRHCDFSLINREDSSQPEETYAKDAEYTTGRMGTGVAMTYRNAQPGSPQRESRFSSARASINEGREGVVDAQKFSLEERNLLRELSVASSLLDDDRASRAGEEEAEPVATPPGRPFPQNEDRFDAGRASWESPSAVARGNGIERAAFLDRNWSALGDPRSAERMAGHRDLRMSALSDVSGPAEQGRLAMLQQMVRNPHSLCLSPEATASAAQSRFGEFSPSVGGQDPE